MRPQLLALLAAIVFLPACDRPPAQSSSGPIAGTNGAIVSTNLTKEQEAALRDLLESRRYPLSREQVVALIRSLSGTDMPTNATEVFGFTRSIFTTVVDVRFDCSQTELRSFLTSSPVLKHDLERDKRTVSDTMANHAWWHPSALTNVSGSLQRWKTTNGTVNCHLMAGSGGDVGRETVYLSFVIE